MRFIPQGRVPVALPIQIDTTMRSPFADCEAILRTETKTREYRGDKYEVEESYYECPITGQTWTTKELDQDMLDKVFALYLHRYGIPTRDEIVKMVEHYGISPSMFGKILGFGENQMKRYLDGEIPSKTNGKLLALARNEIVFKAIVELARGCMSENSYKRVKEKIGCTQCV